MRGWRWTAAIVGAGALVAWLRPGATPEPGAPPGRAPLVLLATRGARTEVLAWDGAHMRALGEVAHAPEAGPRAALLPGGGVLVVADVGGDADGSYGSVATLVAPGRAPRVLADGVALASRPLVTPSGRVYLSRGRAGVPRAGARRDDALALDVLDGVDAAPRTVLATVGWELHAAATYGEAALVYVKSAGGGALDLVDAGGNTRQVAALERWARDFSVAGDAVYFADRATRGSGGVDDGRAGLWELARVELAGDGARRRLLAAPSQHLAPLALADGDVAYSAPGGDGADDGLATLARGLLRPSGAGVDVARAASADGRWLAVAHYAPGAAEADVVLAPVAGSHEGGHDGAPVVRLAAPAGTRYEIVGFASEAGAP